MIPVEKPTRMEWAKDEIEATLSQLKSLQMAGEALHRGVPPDCPSSPASLRPPLPAPGTPTAARRSAAWANSPEIPRSETRGRAVQVGTGLAWGERDEEAQRAREARDSLLDQMRALQNEAQQLL
ncbi:uncharacterized protein LOC142356256 [Convolutriloba macropyga]|uniref:uncharacterized protein LOC142356256 n=1 Tax=Convolutriloba macropyga TaxID=536237 RepID=UPI003F524C5F